MGAGAQASLRSTQGARSCRSRPAYGRDLPPVRRPARRARLHRGASRTQRRRPRRLTNRKRLFLVARCDGKPVVWPEPTHGPGRAHLYRTAAECIDWSIPCPSIFPALVRIAEATCKRIADGLRRFVVESPRPFLAPLSVMPGKADRRHRWQYGWPSTTAASWARTGAPHRDHHRGGSSQPGGLLRGSTGSRSGNRWTFPPDPFRLQPQRARGRLLTKYYGRGTGQSLDEPMHTVVSKDRFGLVTVRIDGETYAIADIGPGCSRHGNWLVLRVHR